MEMKSTFQQDLCDSQLLFKDQFNPNSINFHNGDPTPVPLGGQRVPLSMPTVYHPKSIEKSFMNYGLEYDHLMQKRQFFNGLKKTLAILTPPIEAILRHKEAFAISGKLNNPLHINKLKKIINGEKEKITVVLKELGVFAEIIRDSHDYKESFYSNLNKLIQNGRIDYQDKEQFTGYSFEVKNYSKDVFREMGVLLEKMKAIKKEYDGKGIINEINNKIGTEKSQEEFKKE